MKVFKIGKYWFFSLTFFFLFISTQAQQSTSNTICLNRDSLVNFAKKYIGTPYKWGSSCEKGFDCSGFVSFVFRNFGITTPRGSKEYYHLGKSIPLDSCQKGDVILFTGTNFSRKYVGHVGIIISNPGDPVFFIHSSSSKNHWGVTITDYKNSAYPKRFMGIRRL